MAAKHIERDSPVYGVAQDHPLYERLSSEDQELMTELVGLLGQDADACSKGVRLIHDRLSQPLSQKKALRTIFLYGLACRLVDLGAEAHDEDAVRKALELFEEIEDSISGFVSAAVYKYNRGNALKSIADFYRSPPMRYNLEGVGPLTEAKNMYWRAVRDLEKENRFWPELWVNLANSLNQSSRISEAIYWYDAALKLDPLHPMAHGNRAQALGTLHWLSDQFSISLLAQAARGFQKGLQLPDLQQAARKLWQTNFESLTKALHDLGEPELKEIELEMQIEEASAEHSDYRTFCIGHGLTLCEHGLYCRCIGARRDDLSIMKSASPIPGDFVPRMELLLNRLKAEFAWARALYYQGVANGEGSWDLHPFEGTFSELQDNEAIGLRPEMLRTSLRLCFGILDRVAFGLCDALGIDTFGRPLNFTSFWNDRGLSKTKRDERWRRFNELCTPSLVALYSQATDLNIKKGEWGHFKEWRNALEHRLLFLVQGENGHGPILEGVEVSFKDEVRVPILIFRRECLHMLRFTASAIFNFAFCIRQLALRERREGPTITVTLDKKALGPE